METGRIISAIAKTANEEILLSDQEAQELHKRMSLDLLVSVDRLHTWRRTSPAEFKERNIDTAELRLFKTFLKRKTVRLKSLVGTGTTQHATLKAAQKCFTNMRTAVDVPHGRSRWECFEDVSTDRTDPTFLWRPPQGFRWAVLSAIKADSNPLILRVGAPRFSLADNAVLIEAGVTSAADLPYDLGWLTLRVHERRFGTCDPIPALRHMRWFPIDTVEIEPGEELRGWLAFNLAACYRRSESAELEEVKLDIGKAESLEAEIALESLDGRLVARKVVIPGFSLAAKK